MHIVLLLQLLQTLVTARAMVISRNIDAAIHDGRVNRVMPCY